MDSIARWTGRRVLVTGGTGFVGQRLLAQAIAHKVDVYSVSLSGKAPIGSKAYAVDLRDKTRLRGVIQQIRPAGVFHLAAGGVAYGTGDLNTLLQVNALGLENLLSAIEATDLRCPVIIAGSGLEYAPSERPMAEDDPLRPLTPYGVSKAAATLIAQYYARKIPITVLRLFNVYGNGEKSPRLTPYIIECALNRTPIELTGCEQRRDYTYVEDVAEAFWRAAALSAPEGELRVMNVASGKIIALRTFVEALAAILTEYDLTPQLVFGAKPYRPDEPMVYAANIVRMESLLGWTPSTPLETGLRLTVEAALERA